MLHGLEKYDIVSTINKYNRQIIMKTNRVFAAFMAIAAFYLIGIVINSMFMRLTFNVNATQTPVWSGYGFLALLIAGITGQACVKIYRYLANQDD